MFSLTFTTVEALVPRVSQPNGKRDKVVIGFPVKRGDRCGRILIVRLVLKGSSVLRNGDSVGTDTDGDELLV